MSKTYEIRDAIYGFIELNDWEREIINHPIFQRLRRIRQLSLTDMVYPGAMHTRFEHSLGVMHVATRMYDEIVKRRKEFLKSELSFTPGGLERDRILVRLSCLLHDVGHAPFSHAAEELMDKDPETKKPYKHENYSAAASIFLMRDVIEDHPLSENHKIKAQDIADFLNGSSKLGRCLLWRDLVSSQLDADRADYLLRDSHHAGVAYGKYDLNRLLVTLTVAIDKEIDSPVLAVEEGGEHSAEALIIARYMMFTQVYFQRTRRAYDHHVVQTLKHLLEEHQNGKSLFPSPNTKKDVEEYFKWDDWRVLGMVHGGMGGNDGRILQERRHHRCVYQTTEIPTAEDLEEVKQVASKLSEKGLFSFDDTPEKSWYKPGVNDIPILVKPGEHGEKLIPLSRLSPIVSGMKSITQTRIYVPEEKKEDACSLISQINFKTLEES
jgi:HD superfamily phosphohydrolase